MLIVANWKAYVEEPEKAKKLLALSKRLAGTRLSIVLAPPAPLLGYLAARNPSKIAFAAQDISRTTGGARTGEITAGAYAAARAKYAIIGHSERRSDGDTDMVVAEKLSRALVHGLIPILCVGERERDGKGQYLAYIREQITSALQPLTLKERAKVVIAYEPVWAIGKSAEDAIGARDLHEMALYIRKVVTELMMGKHPKRATILYGGSVEPLNIRGLAGGGGIDGFLIGHASADPAIFAALLKALA